MKVTITCLLVLCWLLPANARADVFLFESAFSTSGAFGCKSFLTCSGEGTNTLTVQNATGTATLTFTGVDSSVAVTNGLTRVTLGTLSMTASPGFVFPAHPANSVLPVLFFSLAIRQTMPLAATNTKHWSFDGGRSSLTVKIGDQIATFASGNPQYPEFVYTFDPFPVTILPNASTAVTANVGATPEPTSLLLLAGGLAATTLRKRRR